MDTLLLARLQFATTTSVHFLFVAVTLGLVTLLVGMQTAWVVTGNPQWERMTRFWGQLYVINYVLGIATGIVMEFQFGLNWSGLSRYVGNVFGAPLAIETLVAFFLESTFLGMWIFGWHRLRRGVHLALLWGVALTAYASAFWIMVANSWLQHPVGYEVTRRRRPAHRLRRAAHQSHPRDGPRARRRRRPAHRRHADGRRSAPGTCSGVPPISRCSAPRCGSAWSPPPWRSPWCRVSASPSSARWASSQPTKFGGTGPLPRRGRRVDRPVRPGRLHASRAVQRRARLHDPDRVRPGLRLAVVPLLWRDWSSGCGSRSG